MLWHLQPMSLSLSNRITIWTVWGNRSLNHLEKIDILIPDLELLGALLIKHDERQNVL